MGQTKVSSKKQSVKQEKKQVKYTSLHWLTSVIWRTPKWRQSTKHYKGRIVVRGDIVKYGSGSYAVFTEQGASAPQMTAAKIMDVTARLPGCAGQTSICLYSGKNGKCYKLTEHSQFGMSRYLDTSTTTQMAKNQGPVWETQSFLLSEICRTIMPSIWKESLTRIVPRIRSLRGGNLEGWRTGCRPWRVGNDGRIRNLLDKTRCERGDISTTSRFTSGCRWSDKWL